MRIGGGSGFWGRDGKADVGVLARVREETRAAFTTQMSAYHSTSELWDDGVLDPHTRAMHSPSHSIHRSTIEAMACSECEDSWVI